MQLPWRREIIEGLLGADLVGFQVPGAASNFARLARRADRATGTDGGLQYDGRVVRVGAFPISIDTADIVARATDPKVIERARADPSRPRRSRVRDARRRPARLHEGHPAAGACGRRAVRRGHADDARAGDGPDRGAEPRGRHALPARARRTSSGSSARSTARTRRSGTRRSTTCTRASPLDELVALYLAADVMLVTPLRDGMNLVAKEYVASRVDATGALVLSEFAGAARELRQRDPREPARPRRHQGRHPPCARSRSGRGPGPDAPAAADRRPARRARVGARLPHDAATPAHRAERAPAGRRGGARSRPATRASRNLRRYVGGARVEPLRHPVARDPLGHELRPGLFAAAPLPYDLSGVGDTRAQLEAESARLFDQPVVPADIAGSGPESRHEPVLPHDSEFVNAKPRCEVTVESAGVPLTLIACSRRPPRGARPRTRRDRTRPASPSASTSRRIVRSDTSSMRARSGAVMRPRRCSRSSMSSTQRGPHSGQCTANMTEDVRSGVAGYGHDQP